MNTKAIQLIVAGEDAVIVPQPAVVGQDDVWAMTATQMGESGMGAWMTKADFELWWAIMLDVATSQSNMAAAQTSQVK
jgi:hypothetical protein